MWTSHCGVFSLSGAWTVGKRASVVEAQGYSSCSSQALEQKLNSCGPWAWLLHDMWDIPRSGTEPMSPALAGESFTTEPPGKPKLC